MERKRDLNKTFKNFVYGLIFILTANLTLTRNLNISGGADVRYVSKDLSENNVKLEGLFLNIRRIFSDAKGDRIILVGQLDLEDNLKKIKPYQTYIQYKGPMGKWNIKLGHYILPFGLLADYDTERMILNTMEDLRFGIRLDTGVELYGYFKDFDYAISLSQGIGSNRLKDIDKDKLFTAKIGWQGESIRMGLSCFMGKVLAEEDLVIFKETEFKSFHKKFLGLDLTGYFGQFVLRGEIDLGKEKNESVWGGLIIADYALTQNLEINLKYAQWKRKSINNFIGVGFSYKLFKGFFIRLANEYQFGKEDKNEFTFQIYYEFSKNF